MNTLSLQGQILAFRDEGAGPILVMLHANPGDSRDFDAITPSLARRHRVLRLDWPGYGQSPAPEPAERAGAGHYLEVFSAFMDALGLKNAVLLGNSVGGNVAIRYALERPERVQKLVLVSTGGFTRHNIMTRGFTRLQGVPGFNRMIGGLFTRAYLRVRNEHTRAIISRGDGEQNSRCARRVNAAVWRSFLDPAHDLREPARGLTVPALVINGRYDPVLPARTDGRRTADAIPQSRFVVMDSGHEPFAELPQDFLATVEPFLAGVANPAGLRAAG